MKKEISKIIFKNLLPLESEYVRLLEETIGEINILNIFSIDTRKIIDEIIKRHEETYLPYIVSYKISNNLKFSKNREVVNDFYKYMIEFYNTMRKDNEILFQNLVDLYIVDMESIESIDGFLYPDSELVYKVHMLLAFYFNL